MIVSLMLILGIIYWIRRVIKKINPDFKYYLKYNVFKKEYNEKEVQKLLDYFQAGWTREEFEKYLLMKGKNLSLKKIQELCYIYKQIQLEGGITNGKQEEY